MKTDTVYFVKNKYTIKAIEPIFVIKYNKIIAYLPWGEGGGHILPEVDSFVCCGSIRDLEKVKFSENS